MNYLTNYYRNLCEQLQEKLNVLEAQLNEFYYGSGGIKTSYRPERMKNPLSVGGADKSKRIPIEFDEKFYRYPLIGERLPGDLLKKIKGAGEETDEDIYGMRQTAVDQGGLPQSMVDAPINRTKQMPDGTLIHGQSMRPEKQKQKEPIKPFGGFNPEDLYVGGKSNLRPRTSLNSAEASGELSPSMRPEKQKQKPGVHVKPPMPFPSPSMRPENPKQKETIIGKNALKAFDSVKTIPGVQAGEMAYGVVPKYGDAGMINSIEKAKKVFNF